VLIVLLNKIISSLLLFQGGTREVSILPLSPLGNPPIPLKRLLKRRRAWLQVKKSLLAKIRFIGGIKL